MRKKELKRLLKLYKSDLNSMADESIKYQSLAERATVDCTRLIAIFRECRERTNRAGAMVERLIDAGQTLADELPYGGNEKIVDEFDALSDEWRHTAQELQIGGRTMTDKIKAGKWTLTDYGDYAMLSGWYNAPERVTVEEARERVKIGRRDVYRLGEEKPFIQAREADELEVLNMWLYQKSKEAEL